MMMLTAGTLTLLPVLFYRMKHGFYFQANIGLLSMVTQLVTNIIVALPCDNFRVVMDQRSWQRMARFAETIELINFLLYTTMRSRES